MFYNTIKLDGQLLIDFREKSANQADVVLYIFQKSPQPLTPFEVQKMADEKGYSWPITSVRRAICDLTNDGRLEKLEDMKAEQYGKPNHKWMYKHV